MWCNFYTMCGCRTNKLKFTLGPWRQLRICKFGTRIGFVRLQFCLGWTHDRTLCVIPLYRCVFNNLIIASVVNKIYFTAVVPFERLYWPAAALLFQINNTTGTFNDLQRCRNSLDIHYILNLKKPCFQENITLMRKIYFIPEG